MAGSKAQTRRFAAPYRLFLPLKRCEGISFTPHAKQRSTFPRLTPQERQHYITPHPQFCNRRSDLALQLLPLQMPADCALIHPDDLRQRTHRQCRILRQRFCYFPLKFRPLAFSSRPFHRLEFQTRRNHLFALPPAPPSPHPSADPSP